MGPKLCKEDIDMLIRNTDFTEEQIQEKLDEFQENFGLDGKVGKEQFFSIYKGLFATHWNRNKPPRFADSLWRHVFNACDQNGDGTVDFKELLMAVDVMNRGSPKEKLEWAFKLYDLSGDGLLSEDEMVAVIRSIHEMSGSTELSPDTIVDQAKAIFVKMDADANSKVTIYEFVHCCLNEPQIYSFLINEE